MPHISVITLFPEACQQFLATSIVGRAQRRGFISLECVSPRQWAGGRHKVVDDRPYGGGPGMVLKAPPIAGCIESIRARYPEAPLLYTSPQGKHLTQADVEDFSKLPSLIILCGHYEGVDERLLQEYQAKEFSIGDFVLSGGELASLVLIDAICRLQDHVLGDEASAVEDSFQNNELDHPSYTKPAEFAGRKVPEVLMSGDHAAIARWRAEQRLLRTRERRPDLLD